MNLVLRQVLVISQLATFASAAPPVSKTIDHVDESHGTKVHDPYRWLEDDARTSKEVSDWVTEQNNLTFGYLESIPQRAAIQKRLTEHWNFERVSPPSQSGGRYFFATNEGLQNQAGRPQNLVNHRDPIRALI